MDYTMTYAISPELARILDEILEGPQHPDHRRDAVIHTICAKFEDGHEADIKVCNGDPSPWIDAPLFDQKGWEVALREPDDGPIEGEYYWRADGDTYTLNLVVEEVANADIR